MAFPPWDAWTVTLPGPVIVSVFPLTAAGPDVTEYDTGRPEDDVAARETELGLTPKVRVPGLGNVMVCVAWLTANVMLNGVAAV